MKILKELKSYFELINIYNTIENNQVIKSKWDLQLIQINPNHIVSIKPIKKLNEYGNLVEILKIKTILDQEFLVVENSNEKAYR